MHVYALDPEDLVLLALTHITRSLTRELLVGEAPIALYLLIKMRSVTAITRLTNILMTALTGELVSGSCE